ncbi:GGDEF domain-containing protein [Neobacillus notoginsengisoli]|uniref:GGDEF domain-containing protein n=1 Tax=Neobacillus notoginsengisoli TaxID=1578198 RepID=UPI001313F937|nr:GGDEF domain-containing protein [Neobacillus notoginsengisoli]
MANLGIMLLMHLSINTSYYLIHENKINKAFQPVIHILIVTASIISMFHFSYMSDGHRVDLRMIPIILLGVFHSWKYVLPVIVISSLYRLGLGGPTAVHGTIFGIIIPSILSLIAFTWRDKKHILVILLGCITVSWLVSDLLPAKIRLAVPDGVALIHLGALLSAFLIMYFFALTGRRHLDTLKTQQFFAERDPLTGLYNMRKFDTKLEQFSPEGKRMFIAMIDIDHFKGINDTLGHQVGDAAIKNVGKILLTYCKKDMFIARWGGDEFIVFMAAERILTVRQELESIRKGVRENPTSAGVGIMPITLSLSIGVAELTDLSHLKETIEEADKQLYLAKKLGRDRVC